MNTLKKNVFVLAIFTSMLTTAQTSNIGELSILSNTQVAIVNNLNNSTSASLMNDGELFIYGDLNNDGLFSYYEATNKGLTRFEGLTKQKIAGNELSEFYNVLFNNSSSSPFELSGDISIVNQANFNQGIVNNNDFGGGIFFEDLANHTNTSNISYVNGEVTKKGNTAFEFPIGDNNNYRSLVISAPATSADAFTSKYFLTNSNTVHPHDIAEDDIEFIDDTEYWTITNDQGASNVMITLSWNANTSPSQIINAQASSIRIVRWNASRGTWVHEGSVADTNTKTVTTVARVSGYGIFTLAVVKDNVSTSTDDLKVFNAVTPNGDGENDVFIIENIDLYPENELHIYNRWGVEVYNAKDYGNKGNFFSGESSGRITMQKNEKLPAGTYFYVLSYKNDQSVKTNKKSGYLYIQR